MRVTLKQDLPEDNQDLRGWLHPDQEHVVLAIEVSLRDGIFYRIASNQGIPALFEATLFAVTDPQLYEGWIYKVRNAGSIELTPEPWSSPGFWEDYFNQDPIALSRFHEVMNQIT